MRKAWRENPPSIYTHMDILVSGRKSSLLAGGRYPVFLGQSLLTSISGQKLRNATTCRSDSATKIKILGIKCYSSYKWSNARNLSRHASMVRHQKLHQLHYFSIFLILGRHSLDNLGNLEKSENSERPGNIRKKTENFEVFGTVRKFCGREYENWKIQCSCS